MSVIYIQSKKLKVNNFTIPINNKHSYPMKNLLLICLLLSQLLVLTACNDDEKDELYKDNMQEQPQPEIPSEDADKEEDNEPMGNNIIRLKIGSHNLSATLADNSSATALKQLLANGDITIAMEDYGNMEKVGPLGTSLPRNDERITTEPGDLILYQGNSFVIYYAPNTWSFTRLGKINNITAGELISILGRGNVSVTLSLD